MLRWFTEHPQSVGESYGQHFKFAVSTGWLLMRAGFLCAVHGLLPFVFKTKAADAVARLAAHYTACERRRDFLERWRCERRKLQSEPNKQTSDQNNIDA